MTKGTWHPNAHLSSIKNIRLGLQARTLLLNALERRSMNARTLADQAGMHYGAVVHHLRLLEAEKIVERKGGRPYVWALTGAGQKRLPAPS